MSLDRLLRLFSVGVVVVVAGLVATATAGPFPMMPPSKKNTDVTFLGWSPDSMRFAYKIDSSPIDSTSDAPPEITYHVKKIAGKLKLVEDIDPKRPVPLVVQQDGFKISPLERTKVDDLRYEFMLEQGKKLVVEVDIKDTLSYNLSSFQAGYSDTILSEGFDDIYVAFDPEVYASPNGKFGVLIMKAYAPYRYRTRIRFFIMP